MFQRGTKYVREKIIELRDKNYKLDTIAAELGITNQQTDT